MCPAQSWRELGTHKKHMVVSRQANRAYRAAQATSMSCVVVADEAANLLQSLLVPTVTEACSFNGPPWAAEHSMLCTTLP